MSQPKPLTLTQRVLYAVIERLETISSDAGYQTDAGDQVRLGKHFYGQLEEDEVRVAVYRGRAGFGQDDPHLLAVRLPVIIEAHLGVGGDAEEAAEAAEELLGDLKKAVLKDADRSLLGLVRNRLYLVSDEVVYPEAGSTTASVKIVMEARTRETYGDPYANE